jgi:hypothetical protein
MVRLSLLTSLLMLSSPAVAGSAAGIYVVGQPDCGTWHRSRSERTSQILEGYVQGLMNGLALGSGVEFWRAQSNSVNIDQVSLWIDKYCTDNPLSDVVAASVTLMNERTGGAYSRSHGD